MNEHYLTEDIVIKDGQTYYKDKIIKKHNWHLKLEELGCGGPKVQFKLHDWLISRQRYWGTPIPVIHCTDCGTIPVSIDDLPVLLPTDIELSSTYGEDLSPLAASEKYITVACLKCGNDDVYYRGIGTQQVVANLNKQKLIRHV